MMVRKGVKNLKRKPILVPSMGGATVGQWGQLAPTEMRLWGPNYVIAPTEIRRARSERYEKEILPHWRKAVAPSLVLSLVVSTHAIANIFKNVPPLFSLFQQSIKYYCHCSDIRNAYVNDMLPMFISANSDLRQRRLISCLTPIEHQ